MRMHIGERNIGDTIRILRIERGMPREELAEKLEISRSRLNNIEAHIRDLVLLHIKGAWMF